MKIEGPVSDLKLDLDEKDDVALAVLIILDGKHRVQTNVFAGYEDLAVPDTLANAVLVGMHEVSKDSILTTYTLKRLEVENEA